jgi:hypothetical protein
MSAVISFLTNISLQGQKLSYVDTAPFNVNGTTYRGLVTFGQSGSDFIITQRFSTFLFHNLQVSESQFVAQLANTPFLPAEIKGAIGSNAFFLTTTNNQTVWFLRTTASTGTQSNVDLVSSQTGFITNSSNSFMTVINSQLSMGPIAAQFNVAQPSNSNIIIGAISLSGGGGGGGITLTPSGALTPPLYYIPFSSATTGAVTTMGTDVSGLIYDNDTHALSVGSIVTNKMGEGPAPSAGNISIGTNALAITTGINNIAIGEDSLLNNSTGFSNVAIGLRSLYSNSTGVNNVAIGEDALAGNGIGGNNLAIGTRSLMINDTGINNIAVGKEACNSNFIGSHNVAVGVTALYSNLNGSGNIAIGTTALRNTTVSTSIAIGFESLRFNTTGSNNIGIGFKSSRANLTGSGNIAIGNNTLLSNLASLNVAVGTDSLRANTNGSNNIALGVNSLIANTTGSSNIAVGNSSLFSNIGGANNIVIGNSAGNNYISSESSNIIIGNPGISGDGFSISGVIRIGTPGYKAAHIPPTLIRKSSASAELLVDTTLTAAQLIGAAGGVVLVGASVTLTMPTAAAITTELGENIAQGDTFDFTVAVTNTSTVTFVGNTNTIIINTLASIITNSRRVVMIFDGGSWNLY